MPHPRTTAAPWGPRPPLRAGVVVAVGAEGVAALLLAVPHHVERQLEAAPVHRHPRAVLRRHRAAVGVTLDNDCIAVVVSEETGGIRIAESGRLSDPIPPKEFRDALLRRLSAQTPGFVFDRRGEGAPA